MKINFHGTYHADLEDEQNIDFIVFSSRNRFEFTFGRGLDVLINVKGTYYISPVDEYLLRLRLSNILNYDTVKKDFLAPVASSFETMVEIQYGKFVVTSSDLPSEIYTRRLYFNDNPFLHLPWIDQMEESRRKKSQNAKKYKSYYYDINSTYHQIISKLKGK